MKTVKTEFPLNPNCRPPVVAGRKLSDKWYVYFFYYVDGKRNIFRHFKGLNELTSLSERWTKANEIRVELEEKLKAYTFDPATKTFIVPVPDTQILQDLLDEYLKDVKSRVVYQTYINYSSVINNFKTHVTGLTLEAINKDFIKAYLKSIDIKPQSKRSYRTYISGFFNWLIEEKKLNVENPTHGVKLPNNLPVERHRVHSKDDIKNVIKYCDDQNDIILKTIIYLVYGAQVRIAEILKIQMQDFRLNENKIVLPKGKGKVKTRSKTVLIDEPLKQYLLKLGVNFNSKTNGEHYFIGIDEPYAKSKFVARLPLPIATLNSRFKKLKKDLKLEQHKTLYSFKHTGNVNLLINGADLIELMYKNGHSRISQTEAYARDLINQVPEIKYIRKVRDDIDFK